MGRFLFRLQRVLEWRQAELIGHERQMKELAARLASLNASREELSASALALAQAPPARRTVIAADLAAAAACRTRLRRRMAALAAEIAACERSLAAQRERLLAARRRVRLLEKLKERRQAEWQAEAVREIDTLASESALARWRRDEPRASAADGS